MTHALHDLPLGAWIARHATASPSKVALRFGEATLSYADLADRIEGLAAGLHQDLTLRPGDRIAYLGHNHPDFLTLLFAAARLGVMVVPLNWRLAAPEHEVILANATPRALVVDAVFRDHVEGMAGLDCACRLIARDFSADGWLGFERLSRSECPAPMVGDDDDPILIVYTSGTTGLAKGAVLTQAALSWNALNSQDMHGLCPTDHVLTVLPLFHVGGLNIQTLPALAIGAEVSLEARFDAQRTLDLITSRKPTLTVLVPATMRALIDHPHFEACDLSSLRQITTGSSIVPPALIRTFHRRGVPVTQVYGTTETAPIAVYQRIDDAWRSVGSSGKVAKHGDMRIVDQTGADPGVGRRGEILIRGPQVMQGYWRNDDATREALVDGWFHTGDIGHVDQAGDLWIDARKDDLIKSGGERIYPAEIEALLRAAPEVRDVAVIGRADPLWGEVPVAVVQLAPGADLDPGALLERLNGKIARFKQPKNVIAMDDLPRNALGKVQRFRLREMLGYRD